MQANQHATLWYRSHSPRWFIKGFDAKKSYGRGIEFIEFCCAISCCMRHMFMVNCTNSGLGIPFMFPGVGAGVVLACAACGGGDDGVGSGMLLEEPGRPRSPGMVYQRQDRQASC